MNPNKNKFYTRGGKLYNSNNRGKPWIRKNNGSPKPSSSSSGNNSNLEENEFQAVNSPYNAWNLYFPEEVFIDNSPTHKKIQTFENFIERNTNLYPLNKIEDNRSFTADLLLISKDEQFLKQWPTFTDDLDTNTELTLNCLSIAMHQAIINDLKNQSIQRGHDLTLERIDLPIIRARIANHQPILKLKNLKVNYFGKLVSVRGTVIRVSNVKLICRSMCFKCGLCGGIQNLNQPDGVYTNPTKCKTKGCRSGKFHALFSSKYARTRTDNWQVLKLQELVGVDNSDGGRIPRTVECELTDDLVDSCVPGDDVTITGIIKVRNTEENNKMKQASIFLLFMDAVSVINNKNQSQVASGAQGIEFNLVDYYAIQKIHAEQHLFKLLVHSLCPGIYGHEMVKAGLLLGLFGGTVKGPGTRADPHILMVGDPGLGKSQMLQACANVAPRGVFVCGNTSTSSGLTVTMTRESGEYSLEAGALVLADQGCCCIDEFDKMPTQHSALLEAMEQQSVSIAKAGVVCTLPARTSILAAANPAGGHYNKGKTVSENLRIGAALLSRFDLVFILRDKPNQVLDSLLSEHVLALHTSNIIKNVKSKHFVTSTPCTSSKNADDMPLQDRLQKHPTENIDVLPHQLLRKYIAYARKYVNPTLSIEAATILKTFYLELRKKHQTSDCTPVTTRQAQSLARLTLARAKLEMRETATEQDAQDVIELMKYSLVDTFSDEYDNLDFTRSQHGSGMSKRNQVKKFVALLQKKAEHESNNIFTINELKAIASRNGLDDFHNLLNALNIHGYLLKKESNKYKLLSVD